MKKNDLIKVIREIVKQEIKKELPTALAQMFANLMTGKSPIVSKPTDIIGKEVSHTPRNKELPEESPSELDEMVSLKSQLQEMFNSGDPVQHRQSIPQKHYSTNPILNEVLNQTSPFNSSERMAMRAGGGLVGGMAPGVAMAAAQYGPVVGNSNMGVGEVMSESEMPSFARMPIMPGADTPMLTEPPAGGAPISMGNLMDTPSALDVKNHPGLPDSIKNVLNRDYRSLVKAMDKKKPK